MNRLLDNVVSDITGVTGMAIMRAILAGERDAGRLAALRDRRCRADERVIAGSLEGHYHEEHLFELRQAVERHDFLGGRSRRARRRSAGIWTVSTAATAATAGKRRRCRPRASRRDPARTASRSRPALSCTA